MQRRRMTVLTTATTMLIFVAAGIMQFHHHHSCHCHSLCIYVLEELAGHDHIARQDTGGTPDTPESDCAMHLSDFQPNEHPTLSEHHICDDNHGDGPACGHSFCVLPIHERCTEPYIPDDGDSRHRPTPHPCHGHNNVNLLRGPPLC